MAATSCLRSSPVGSKRLTPGCGARPAGRNARAGHTGRRRSAGLPGGRIEVGGRPARAGELDAAFRRVPPRHPTRRGPGRRRGHLPSHQARSRLLGAADRCLRAQARLRLHVPARAGATRDRRRRPGDADRGSIEPRHWGSTVLVFLFGWATYALFYANYALFTASISSFIVFFDLRRRAHVLDRRRADDRHADRRGIALTAFLVWPTWEGTRRVEQRGSCGGRAATVPGDGADPGRPPAGTTAMSS